MTKKRTRRRGWENKVKNNKGRGKKTEMGELGGKGLGWGGGGVYRESPYLLTPEKMTAVVVSFFLVNSINVTEKVSAILGPVSPRRLPIKKKILKKKGKMVGGGGGG